ncbi:MAG: sigma-70 family RNA polymerase sigma factor [Micavibrio sp.]
MTKNKYSGVDSYAAFFIGYKARTLIRMPMFSRDDLEDLEQELMLYYLLSMPDFNPQKGDRRSFIKTVVNRKALMIVRDAERQKRWSGLQNFSLSHKIGNEDDGITLADIIASDEGIWGDALIAYSQTATEQNMDIAKIVATMPPDIKDVYQMLEDYSVAEMAQKLGIAPSSVYSRIERLRKYIKEAMK